MTFFELQWITEEFVCVWRPNQAFYPGLWCGADPAPVALAP